MSGDDNENRAPWNAYLSHASRVPAPPGTTARMRASAVHRMRAHGSASVGFDGRCFELVAHATLLPRSVSTSRVAHQRESRESATTPEPAAGLCSARELYAEALDRDPTRGRASTTRSQRGAWSIFQSLPERSQ